MRANICPERYSAFLSALFFLLLFPGFYFYHQGVASGVLPRFLGGFFSPLCALLLMLYPPLSRPLWQSLNALPFYSLVLILFFIWTVSSSLINAIFLAQEYTWDALYQYMNAVLNWLALIIVGVSLNFNASWFRRLLWMSGGLILVMIFDYFVTTGNLQYNAIKFYEADEGVSTYQGFARSALVLSFALVAITSVLRNQVVVSSAAIFVLFVLSARSEFAAILIVSAMYYFLIALRSGKNFLLAIFVMAISIFAFIYFQEEITSTRQGNLLNLSSDNSWNARQELSDAAWKRIMTSPVLGDFGGHFESGEQGRYAHNILGAWDSFGLVGFLMMLYLIFTPFVGSASHLLTTKIVKDVDIFYFFVSASSLLLILFTKAIYWPIPALAWGLHLAAKSRPAGQ